MDFIKIYIMDIILLLIFLICLLYYYLKGFVRSILGFASLFASAVLTRVLSPFAVRYFCANVDYFKSDFGEYKANIVSVAALFVFLNIIFKIIIFIIDKAAKLPVVKTVNKSLGLLLGALSGLIVVAVCIMVVKFVILFDVPQIRQAADNSLIIRLYSELIIYIYPTINRFIQGGLK